MEKVLLALGSNLGNRQALLRQARRELAGHPEISVIRSSSLYETEPVGGPENQERYLNAVLEILTSLSPKNLLAFCLNVEERCGRIRRERWGPRSVDVDILFYADRIIRHPELTVPHPRLHERRFVLEPLVELAPEFVHPLLDCTCRDLLGRLPPVSREVTLFAKDW